MRYLLTQSSLKEQFQMTGLDIQNPFREKAYQIAQLPLQTGILPHAERLV